ncbi:MAG: GNAT family N-acetyltransferase [Acidobacteria bacterium]|nr:GNAT family N-acetyltransferase [Acidobacteriota bacterium]
MLQTRVVSDQTGLLDLKNQWHELLARSNATSPFLTWEWISSWWRIMSDKNQELFVICVMTESGELLAIVPFLRKVDRACGIPASILEFIGADDDTCADYMDLIVSHRDLDAVADSLLQYFQREGTEKWDVILLSGIPQTGNFRTLVHRFAAHKYEVREQSLDACPYIDLPEKWEDYLSGLSKKSRYNVGKKRRNLDQVCKNRFHLLVAGDDLDAALERNCELQKKRLEMKGIDRSSKDTRFYELQSAVAREFHRKGWLFLGVLEANGRTVASQYAFRWRNKVFHYQTGFDPEFERYSVGLISTGFMIETAIGEKLTEYDFLRGREDYKYHWAKQEREIFSCYIGNKNYRSRLFTRRTELIRTIKTSTRNLFRGDSRRTGTPE